MVGVRGTRRGTGRGHTSPPSPRRSRTAAALAAGALALSLAACDALPFPSGGTDGAPSPTAAPAMDPEAVAQAEATPVDPSWLCRPGEGEPPVDSAEGGTMTPRSVRAEGNVLEVTGEFELASEHEYRGFAPLGVLLPADPAHRGSPAHGFDGELGVEGAPVPPMVVRERVEVPGEGAAPQGVTARLTLGTCDDSPLPEGQFLLRLSGAIDPSARGSAEAGWAASDDVLVDVVDGRVQAVPGAVAAPSGEVPADLSPLGCRSHLAPLGDGDGLTVSVQDPPTTVPAAAPEDEEGAAVTAELTVASQDRGTRALLQGIVLTHPATGTVVAGARNTPSLPLQWIGEEGVTRTERAWTSHGTCGGGALVPGDYRAHGFAATVDAEGRTQLVLSEAWDVEVTEADQEPAP